MVRRVAFAAVAIPLALGIVWFGGWPLALTVSLVSALGTREFYDLALKNGIDAARRFGIASAALCGPLALLASPRGPLAGVSSIAAFIGWWPYLGRALDPGIAGMGPRAGARRRSGRSRPWR